MSGQDKGPALTTRQGHPVTDNQSLRSVGERMDHKWIRRAVDWLRSVQKPDGSFGESCDTYENPSLKGRGPSTPSQTAWGAMGLMAAAGQIVAAERVASCSAWPGLASSRTT